MGTTLLALFLLFAQPPMPPLPDDDDPEQAMANLLVELDHYPPLTEIQLELERAGRYVEWLEIFIEINKDAPDVRRWGHVWLTEAGLIHDSLLELKIARTLPTILASDPIHLEAYRNGCRRLGFPPDKLLPGVPWWRVRP